ncbi:SnoaL-like protein [Tamaricihabitans halophyticus]|uniref:SnoaL-like protein n=1 Tax=Tamaricihabitans halophyticus TaxID=1262583 RepID=A0A4V2SUM3_9PSEU|nr:nuclear transport factor 2 family protein [Tamaricihabitans halophyticus]TCP55136.1 SnoaL-like protein [Tamaricihabitans halophyticus]
MATRFDVPRPARRNYSVDPADVFEAYNDAVNLRDVRTAQTLLSPNLSVTINERPAIGFTDGDQVTDELLLRCFPNCRREILRTLVQSNQAAVRWRLRGEPARTFAGLPELDVHGCMFVRVRDGRMAQVAMYFEDLGLRTILARARDLLARVPRAAG